MLFSIPRFLIPVILFFYEVIFEDIFEICHELMAKTGLFVLYFNGFACRVVIGNSLSVIQIWTKSIFTEKILKGKIRLLHEFRNGKKHRNGRT